MFVGLAVALSALQAQNTVTVGDVSLKQGESAVISVELANETAFSAFQMDLILPVGFEVATTLNEDDEEVLDIALSADRKKSTHSLSYNVFPDGAIRIASFSSTNATYKGQSGAIVQFRIVATESAVAGTHAVLLDNVIFTTPDAVDFAFDTVEFALDYSASSPNVPDPDVPNPDVPETPERPVDPEISVNEVYASDLYLNGVGNSEMLSVLLNNETAFSAFQMDLRLPVGFEVATTLNEDGEEVLDISLSADRKKSTHSLSYNVFPDGTIRIASFSSTNATYKGQSGDIVQFRILATESAVAGVYTATLRNVIFTTPDAVDYPMADSNFQIAYTTSSSGGEVDHKHSVEVHVGNLGRCVWDGVLIGPYGSYSKVYDAEQADSLHLFFIPFDGYQASSIKRNGELVEIRNNVYEESLVEDVVFTDVCYSTIVDTLVVTETVIDTLVVTETIVEVDTLVVTETVVDTLVVTETIVEVDTLVVTETVVDTLVLSETVIDTLVVTETIVEVDTLVVTETVVDTLVLTETVIDTLVVTETIIEVDTLVVEKVDTVFITEVGELPIPVITCEEGVVTITCDDPDVFIFYAIDGSPLEGGLYTGPFEMTSNGIVSAVAIRCSEVATQYVVAGGVAQSAMRIVGCRYYTEDGVEVLSPEKGIIIVSAEYEDGTTRVFKMVKK